MISQHDGQARDYLTGLEGSHLSGVLDIAEELVRSYGQLPEVASVAAQSWRCPRRRGAGVSLGLIEPAMHQEVPDLVGAAIVLRSFASNPAPAEALMAHGTHSATLLVGQGHRFLLGLVPRARLSVALVAQADGTARPDSMAAAIDWLVAQAVALLAIPLGDTVDHEGIGQALERARRCGVRVFAAAGNAHPEALVFPARHSAALAIGAVDPSGRLRAECCRLPALDGLAPGSDIPACVEGWRVERRSGSSVACVVAAGLAALSLSESGGRPPPDAQRNFATASSRRRTCCPTARKESSNV